MDDADIDMGTAKKGYQNMGLEPYLYFYRDGDAKEIDVISEGDGKLCPIEIKKSLPRTSA